MGWNSHDRRPRSRYSDWYNDWSGGAWSGSRGQRGRKRKAPKAQPYDTCSTCGYWAYQRRELSLCPKCHNAWVQQYVPPGDDRAVLEESQVATLRALQDVLTQSPNDQTEIHKVHAYVTELLRRWGPAGPDEPKPNVSAPADPAIQWKEAKARCQTAERSLAKATSATEAVAKRLQKAEETVVALKQEQEEQRQKLQEAHVEQADAHEQFRALEVPASLGSAKTSAPAAGGTQTDSAPSIEKVAWTLLQQITHFSAGRTAPAQASMQCDDLALEENSSETGDEIAEAAATAKSAIAKFKGLQEAQRAKQQAEAAAKAAASSARAQQVSADAPPTGQQTGEPKAAAQPKRHGAGPYDRPAASKAPDRENG